MFSSLSLVADPIAADGQLSTPQNAVGYHSPDSYSTTESTSGELPRLVFHAVKVAKTCDATLSKPSERQIFEEDGEPSIEGGGEKYEAPSTELDVFVETRVCCGWFWMPDVTRSYYANVVQ